MNLKHLDSYPHLALKDIILRLWGCGGGRFLFTVKLAMTSWSSFSRH